MGQLVLLETDFSQLGIIRSISELGPRPITLEYDSVGFTQPISHFSTKAQRLKESSTSLQYQLPGYEEPFCQPSHREPGMQSTPLLPGGQPRRRVSTRAVAVTFAAVCTVGAVAAVAVMVQGGPTALLQKGMVKLAPVRGMVPMQAMGNAARGADPVYYVPMKQVRKSRTGQLAKAPQPVVYYYLPEQKAAARSEVFHQVQMLANDTAGNDTADAGGEEFVCTVDNIKALSGTVQAEWDKCKENDGYKEPNKGAARRLLGWVWEPESSTEHMTAAPKYGPAHYHLKLTEADRHHYSTQLQQQMHTSQMLNETEGNATAGGGGGDGGAPSFDSCQKAAAQDACAKIAACKDPVCDNYYNEPEIEALCGICTMAPLGCFARSAEVTFMILD